MDSWPDAKIRSTALWYIGKATMDPPSWSYTQVGEAQPVVLSLADLQPAERPIVSFFLSAESWYLFTTRRILGEYAGLRAAVPALDVQQDHFGNFKKQGGTGLEAMTLRLVDGTDLQLQYETHKASLAPIYYFRYWKIKYPFLDKLKG